MRVVDRREVAEELKQVFRTGDRNYTVEKAWVEWQSFCDKWGRYYRTIKRRRDDCSYKLYFTYLNYDYRTVNDLHDKLDRAAPEGLQKGHQDAMCDA